MGNKKSHLQKRKRIDVFTVKPPYNEKTLIKICKDLLKDRYFITGRYPVVKLKGENIWIQNPLKDRSWRFWFHTLIAVEYLVVGYERTGDKRYLDKAINILWDWNKKNSPKSKSEMAWHDHSTALRLIVVCKLFETWKEHHWDKKIVKLFSKNVIAHCTKLADPGFYMEKHNHGLDQDIALYIGSVVFDHLTNAHEWKELALKRFWKQIEQLFAPDGSYLEHSPGYSYIFCKRLFNFLTFLQQQKNPTAVRLEETLMKQLHFLTHLIQPDGQIPPIGDSDMHPMKIEKWNSPTKEAVSGLRYIISRGEKGVPPQTLNAIFPIGGYATLRNKWEYDHETVQIIFQSSFHSRVHKHKDDLSITVFGHGQPLLVDAGRYNYNYQSRGRQYVVSTRAHNTVVVDGKDFETIRLNIGKSGLTGYYFDEDFAFVSGSHSLYPKVVHQRIVLYLKPWNCIVLDFMQGDTEHQFEQCFNFFPNVKCELVDKTIIGSIEDSPSISISPLVNQQQFYTNLVRGNKDPLIGWCSLEYSKLVTAWAGNYMLKGKEARFATHINLRPSTNPITYFQWQDDVITIKYENNEVTIHLGHNGNELLLNERLVKMNHIRRVYK